MIGRRVSTLAALVLLLLVALMPPMVEAHDRELTIETEEGNRIEILSETPATEGEVDIRFRAETTGRPKLAVAAELETGNDTVEQETDVEFSAAFRMAFEFEDSNGNGIQDTEESALSFLRLETLTYDPIAVVAHSSGGLEGFKVTLLGERDGFSFGLVSYIFPSEAVVNGTPVPEQAVKVDILMEGYPFTSEASLLGLEIGVESTVEREIEFEETRETVEVSTERGTAFFQWSPEAQVDSQSVSVTSLWRSQDNRVFLYYQQGQSIVHDPLLGFGPLGGSPLLNPTSLALIAIAGLAALALGIALYVQWSRKSRGGP